ncbi:MAG: 23S rRNA (adenine(2503)-C(2))-methyltransferase RlmN [Candidatus Nealsonbacteria bacterium]|nr:23S rRNA (adenine(2503)-C(2))-methyltransferase RlmN [Candidatus Nealsonbacteria bacterium]
MDFNKIKFLLESEPSYRLKQIKKALFSEFIDNWKEVSNLPKKLIDELLKNYPIDKIFKEEKVLVSDDNQTLKALFTLDDGLKIESVLMKHRDKRRTVCVSSQAGCSLGCDFCATGREGFKRNLSPSEITNQVLFFSRFLKKSKERVTNIVFMGMGEPFFNYDNVFEAIRIFNDKDGFNIGIRHISVSSSGIIEGIERLAQEKLQINLAISLHAPNNELRTKIMPVNKTYPIEKILEAVDKYVKKTKRKVMFEYLMIDKINDSTAHAEELARIMKNPLYFVNLISFNPIGHSLFKPSPGHKIKKFKQVLEGFGVNVTQRYRFGREIKAACGQLASDN